MPPITKGSRKLRWLAATISPPLTAAVLAAVAGEPEVDEEERRHEDPRQQVQGTVDAVAARVLVVAGEALGGHQEGPTRAGTAGYLVGNRWPGIFVRLRLTDGRAIESLPEEPCAAGRRHSSCRPIPQRPGDTLRYIRRRLTYANVMSSLAVFMVLCGGAAFAANQLPKNSVGPKQLKKNAVKTGDIARNSVKTGKLGPEAAKAGKIAKNAIPTNRIRNGAVSNAKVGGGAITGDKIAGSAVTGDKINAPTTPFGRVVDRPLGAATVAFTGGQLYPLVNPFHLQPAGQTEQYIGGMSVHFPAACTQPRLALAYLLMDSATPTAPSPVEIIGFGQIEDKATGAVNRRMAFAPFAGGLGAPWRSAPPSNETHTFSILMLGQSCNTGSGVLATGASIDVIGTK